MLTTVLLSIVSFIDVPTKNNRVRIEVPNRIAEFISRKEKPIVEQPKPQKKILPKPSEELVPETVVKPVVERTRVTEAEQKPLTESQKHARKVAEKSGLLALANELNDLIETTDAQNKVNRQLSAEFAGSGASTVAAGLDASGISAGVAQSGGRVDASQYTGGGVGGAVLESRNTAKLTDELLASSNKINGASTAAKNSSGSGTAGEDVTIVFDKNKGGLYSLYERERRTTPGLQGKIVLQLIISPEGTVIDIKIISSELNNPALEAKLISRIKLFKFKSGGEKPITITYPIEFLPS